MHFQWHRMENVRQLGAGARSLLGLCLTAEHLAAFQTYYEELTAWNQRFNLTAIVGHRDVQIKHFLDSLTCLLALPTQGRTTDHALPDTVPIYRASQPLRCIDIGTGAGFPGLPLKIVRPELVLTLLESTAKKTVFLKQLVNRLDLENVEIIHGRAEDLGRDPRYRERYDVVLARAVAQLQTLAEYCLPFCKVGGRFVAQKGPDISAELDGGRTSIGILGGEVGEVKAIHIPELDQERHLITVRKVKPTPEKYPRRAGTPSKNPLR